MSATIHATQLRKSLARLVARVRRGTRLTVLYRGRPAFQIVPIAESTVPMGLLEADPLYRAGPVGRSTDGSGGDDHDRALYGR